MCPASNASAPPREPLTHENLWVHQLGLLLQSGVPLEHIPPYTAPPWTPTPSTRTRELEKAVLSAYGSITSPVPDEVNHVMRSGTPVDSTRAGQFSLDFREDDQVLQSTLQEIEDTSQQRPGSAWEGTEIEPKESTDSLARGSPGRSRSCSRRGSSTEQHRTRSEQDESAPAKSIDSDSLRNRLDYGDRILEELRRKLRRRSICSFSPYKERERVQAEIKKAAAPQSLKPRPSFEVDDEMFRGDNFHVQPEQSTAVPTEFPRHTVVDGITDLGKYLASSKYVVSLGGPPLSELEYGIVIVPVGEEGLLFRGSQQDVMMADQREHIYRKSHVVKRQAVQEFKHSFIETWSSLCVDLEYVYDIDEDDKEFYRQRWLARKPEAQRKIEAQKTSHLDQAESEDDPQRIDWEQR